jgi:hypothetical protein
VQVSSFNELSNWLCSHGFVSQGKTAFERASNGVIWQIRFERTPSVRHKGFVSIGHASAEKFVERVVESTLNDRCKKLSVANNHRWWSPYRQVIDLFLFPENDGIDVNLSRDNERQLAFQMEVIGERAMPMVRGIDSPEKYLQLLVADEHPFGWYRDSAVMRTAAIYFLCRSIGLAFPALMPIHEQRFLGEAMKDYTFRTMSEYIGILENVAMSEKREQGSHIGG